MVNWTIKKQRAKNYKRYKQKTIHGGSGRGASGFSSLKKTQAQNLKPFDTNKLIGLITYYEAFSRLKPYTNPSENVRRKIVSGELSPELKNGELRMLLHNDKASKINKLLAERDARIRRENKQPDEYIPGDAELLEKLNEFEKALKDFTRRNPYFKDIGKAVPISAAPSVATNEPSSAKKPSAKSPPKRNENYFIIAKLFLDTFAAFETLTHNPRLLPPEQRIFSDNQIRKFRPHILNEIDKEDVENRKFIIEHPEPSYPTQVSMEPKLLQGIERLLELIKKYRD
jgi:hypothetical protein